MTKQKNILPSLVRRVVIVLIMALLAFLFARVIAYFETTNTTISQVSYFEKEELLHQPTINWVNKTDVLNDSLLTFQRSDIEEAYKGAWYRLNKSLRTNNNYGLEDYFSDSLVAQITETFSDDFTVNQVDLTHNLNLHLISVDEIVVAFKDENINQLKEITANNNEEKEKLIHEQAENLAYEIVMKLTDGRWKIIEMVRKENIDKTEDLAVNTSAFNKGHFAEVKGINYYPASSPWHLFWKDFNTDTITQDFRLIEALGYNTVRVFIPFFKQQQQQQKGFSTKKLEQLLTLAEQANLQLIPTLFDFPQSFNLDYYPVTQQYLNAVVKPFVNNTNIYAWDIKNEPDLDFKYHPKRKVIKHLDFSITYLGKLHVSQPITIGWMDYENAHLLSNKIDFVTFHFYDSVKNLPKQIDYLTSKTDKPVMLGEFGHSSYAWFGDNKEKQQNYNSEIVKICEEKSIPNLVWTLHDFKKIPDGVFGWKPWIKWQQAKFGINKTK